MFVDKRYNVRNYRKMLKNESLQLTKKEMAVALNTEDEKNSISDNSKLESLKALNALQEKEQKVLHLFGFVNKNKFKEVEVEEECIKPAEKNRVKNKQHRNRQDNRQFITKQLKI